MKPHLRDDPAPPDQRRPVWPLYLLGLAQAIGLGVALWLPHREPDPPYLKCTPAEEWPREPGKRRPPRKSFVAPAGTLARFEGFWCIVDANGDARMLPVEITPVEDK